MLYKIERTSQLIQKALAEIIHLEHISPDINLIELKLSKDFSYADAYISSKQEETITKLNKLSKVLRYKLAHRIKLRRTPMLRFKSYAPLPFIGTDE